MAPIDVDQLRVGLSAYQQSLEAQALQLRVEWHELEVAWRALNSSYGGTSAEEFQRAWSQTADWFLYYIDCSHAMANELRSRVDQLAHL